MEISHDGHRKRLKNRVKKYGLSSLAEHEILELVLMYAIPRKNTNPIAHELLNKFGSLSGVIDADINQLKLIKGLGEESAFFLTILREFVHIYLENKKQTEDIIFKNNQNVITYFRSHFLIKPNETFIGFCLSKKGKLLNYFTIEGTNETEITFPVKTLIDYVSPDNVSQLILVHTHPNGNVSPSSEDIETTARINNICIVLGCNLVDHLIINDKTYCSLKEIGYMPKSTSSANVKIELEKDGYIIKRKCK